MEKVSGLINAPFTPFHPNGEVNYEPIAAYCDMLVRNGIKGVFVNGSSGEGYMLTEQERMSLAEKWMEVAPSGFKVLIHVGSTCVKMSCNLAAHAQSIGAFAIGAMASPFPKAGNCETLVSYCEEIAAAASALPFYFYHIPALSGVYLPMLPFLQLAAQRIPNLAGIKYTYESLYEFNQCRLWAGDRYQMFHGQDETILAALGLCGELSGICGTTNYNGRVLVDLVESWKQGDWERARELQNFAQQVINIIIRYRGNIVGGKHIMKMIGLDMGGNRTPFQGLSAAEYEAMHKELEAIRFFEYCNR